MGEGPGAWPFRKKSRKREDDVYAFLLGRVDASMVGVNFALPEPVDRVVTQFVEAARQALGSDLRSIVIYGSAAEGRLRPTSDVNVIIVLAVFDPAKVDRLRDPLRTAHAAVRFAPMFLLESEVEAAVEAFAVKFADVLRRRHVVFGSDPFAGHKPSRNGEIARLKQVLLNLTLRLRQQYMLLGLREEQAAMVVAETAGPIRACAATLLELQGKGSIAPKEALQQLVTGLPGGDWGQVLRHISEAREVRSLPPGTATPTLLRIIELTQALRAEVDALAARGS